MPDFLKLPSERVEQLRLISKARDLPIADLIAEFVRDQIDAGHIPAGVPGITIHRTASKLLLDFGDFTKSLDLELAGPFATALRWMAEPKRNAMHSAITDLAKSVSGAHVVGLTRQGPGVRISAANGSRVVAASVAIDLADEIERIAAA